MSTKTYAYSELCSGICDNHSTAIVTKDFMVDGKKTVKIQPTPRGAMAGYQHIIVDALELAKFDFDLDKDIFLVLEYKYETPKPLYDQRLGINIMRSTSAFRNHSIGVFSNDKVVAGGWQKAVFNFTNAIKEAFVEGSHVVNQFHLFPFGNMRPAGLTENDIMYIGDITFTSENPEPNKKYKVEFTKAGFDCVEVPGAMEVKPGEKFTLPECKVNSDDIVFGGWQYNMSDYMTSGYVTPKEINLYLNPGDEVEMPYEDLLFFPRLTRVIKNKTKAVIDADAIAKAEKKVAEVEALSDKRREEILSTKDTIVIKGTKYYVSNSGNDENDGKSPETAWATIDRANNHTYEWGDGVLFNRGDFFRGNLLTYSGVTYAAYGEGAKPKLSASEENGAGEEKWILVEGTTNVWKFYRQMVDIGGILADRGDGEFICEKVLACLDVEEQKYYKKSDKSVIFDPKVDLENLTFFNLTKSTKVTEDRVDMYFRCDEGNPGKVFTSIEFLDGKTHTIRAKSDVTIDNLCVLHTARHGIGAGSCKNLVITNSEIGWIGGGLFGQWRQASGVIAFGRFGNGIEVYGACDNFVIDNCYVYQCFDAGITNQLQKGEAFNIVNKDVKFTNNLIEYCCYNIEYFMGIGAVEVTRLLDNVLYEGNICRMAGFGWGRVNPTNSANIKGWDHRNESVNFVIKNNIFDRAYGDLLHIGTTRLEWMPEFSGNTYVQYRNSLLGHIGPNPTIKYIKYMDAEDIVYDENVIGFISDVMGDDVNEVYFLDERK